ncbi:hypothetical protein [Paractinoplanes durhamensis]|uniref:hypothetical protein n=1 Tax=Paractinoplanes durhamensis TaxID=113563 RepID=UPI0019418B8C|nr:hypothetical protein [Actinoplanes durhamensis]
MSLDSGCGFADVTTYPTVVELLSRLTGSGDQNTRSTLATRYWGDAGTAEGRG